MRKKLIIPFLMMLIALLSISCTKTYDYGLGNFKVDLATVVEGNGGRFYQLDNQDTLFPNATVSSSLKTGGRVLLNYEVTTQKGDKEYTIKVNSVSATNTGTIKSWANNLPDDSLRIDAIWLKGDWLNFRLAFNYFSVKHGIDLLQRPALPNDTLFLDLRHSKNGDPEGYFVNTYVSFNLKSFAEKDSIPVKVRANSITGGERLYFFKYATPNPN